jgi:hypothetical protein
MINFHPLDCLKTQYFNWGRECGSDVPILDPNTGTTRAAQIVVLGFSDSAHADGSLTQAARD